MQGGDAASRLDAPALKVLYTDEVHKRVFYMDPCGHWTRPIVTGSINYNISKTHNTCFCKVRDKHMLNTWQDLAAHFTNLARTQTCFLSIAFILVPG